jgi:hypothetical protein
MRILIVGDVVSKSGCDFFAKTVPNLKRERNIDLVIVNGENSAVGNGVLPTSADFLLSVGADIITLGNHALRRPEIYDYLNCENNPIIRPANFDKSAPGFGSMTADMGRVQVGVINLIGSVYMSPCENPFERADKEIEKLKNDGVKIIIVDFHAEATAEKRAMGYYLDGKVTAVVGTHTHIQTSDEQILDGGTAYITDLGMTGPADSVLGVDKECAIQRIKTNLPVRFTNPETDKCVLEGVILETDEKTGKAINIERIRLS